MKRTRTAAAACGVATSSTSPREDSADPRPNHLPKTTQGSPRPAGFFCASNPTQAQLGQSRSLGFARFHIRRPEHPPNELGFKHSIRRLQNRTEPKVRCDKKVEAAGQRSQLPGFGEDMPLAEGKQNSQTKLVASFWRRLFGSSEHSSQSFASKGAVSPQDSKNNKLEIPLRSRDCHCHVIPGVDDGSRCMEESLAMLRLLHEAGAQTVIATPHIFPGRFPNEPEDLRPPFEALVEAKTEAGIEVELELGAEHYLDDSLAARIREGRHLSFGAESYVLFETSTGPETPPDLYPVIHALREGGHTPLLAHVERYRWLRGEEGEEIMADLRAAGVRFQVNRTVGQMNRPGVGRRGIFLARLLELGWVDEVGSDLHRPTAEGRPYAMEKGNQSAKAGAAVSA